MSSQTEEPLVPGHVGFNDAHSLLDAEAQSSSPSNSNKSQTQTQSRPQSQAQLPTQNKGSKVAEVNIGNDSGMMSGVVSEEEVGDEVEKEGETKRGEVVGVVNGEGQKAMREGRHVI